MKLTFIGAGNMGGAAAMGFAKKGAVAASDITVTTRHEDSLQRFRAVGINGTTDNVEAVKTADIVFFVVKPWLMEQVTTETKVALDYEKQLIVSMAPGVTSSDLMRWLDKGEEATKRYPDLAYVIPNTAVEIGESMTFVAPVSSTPLQTQLLKSLFDQLGTAVIVEEKMMLAGTSLSSCGIAYAMRYISAAAEGGKELGLPEKDIERVVCQTVKGAAELIVSRGTDAETEIDKVTTPGGLTLKGLGAMEKAGFTTSVIEGLKAVSGKRHRVVVKIGASVLTRQDGALDTTRVSALVDQVVSLKKSGCEIILVTSGAVACGRSLIPENRKLDDVQQRQLYSAIGQVRLMDMYYRLFLDYGINVGQILTMKKNFDTNKECENQKSCMEVMLQSGVLPIVNENDTVSITELMFTDNDELSELVAEMMGADTLILLDSEDGITRGGEDGETYGVVPVIHPGESIMGVVHDEEGSRITSICSIALMAAEKGIRVMVANGRRENILVDLMERPETTVHTSFVK